MELLIILGDEMFVWVREFGSNIHEIKCQECLVDYNYGGLYFT